MINLHSKLLNAKVTIPTSQNSSNLFEPVNLQESEAPERIIDKNEEKINEFYIKLSIDFEYQE